MIDAGPACDEELVIGGECEAVIVRGGVIGARVRPVRSGYEGLFGAVEGGFEEMDVVGVLVGMEAGDDEPSGLAGGIELQDAANAAFAVGDGVEEFSGLSAEPVEVV